MKILRTGLLSLSIAFLVISSAALAAGPKAEERGRTLFNDPKFAGGNKACASCHPDGRGLEKAAVKKELMTPMGPSRTLEEAINICIINGNKGKAIDVKSRQMKDMVAYIRSLNRP